MEVIGVIVLLALGYKKLVPESDKREIRDNIGEFYKEASRLPKVVAKETADLLSEPAPKK